MVSNSCFQIFRIPPISPDINHNRLVVVPSDTLEAYHTCTAIPNLNCSYYSSNSHKQINDGAQLCPIHITSPIRSLHSYDGYISHGERSCISNAGASAQKMFWLWSFLFPFRRQDTLIPAPRRRIFLCLPLLALRRSHKSCNTCTTTAG